MKFSGKSASTFWHSRGTLKEAAVEDGPEQNLNKEIMKIHPPWSPPHLPPVSFHSAHSICHGVVSCGTPHPGHIHDCRHGTVSFVDSLSGSVHLTFIYIIIKANDDVYMYITGISTIIFFFLWSLPLCIDFQDLLGIFLHLDASLIYSLIL